MTVPPAPPPSLLTYLPPPLHSAPSPVSLTLAGTALASTPRVEFILTAPGNNMTADAVLLNDVPLGVDASGMLAAQPIPGKVIAAGGAGAITLPGQSYGYIVLTGAGAAACV